MAGGRAASTTRTYPPAGQTGVLISNPSVNDSDGDSVAVVLKAVTAFEMGCGWEKQ